MAKYKKAGEISKIVLNEVISQCIPNADIRNICIFGNKRILEECSKCYNSKKIEKGVAFPVSISPDNICGHYSPIE